MVRAAETGPTDKMRPAHIAPGTATAALTPGVNCWRIEQADRFAFIVDAADYFTALRRAMLKARHSILMIGWDFDARIAFGTDDPSGRGEERGGDRTGDGQGDPATDAPADGGPECLGDFILWLADRAPGLEIRLLRWDTGAFKALLRGNTLWTVLRWKAHPRITLRLDAAHPLASAHHQKIVVIDDSIAFCGGIDMTMQRWDTRAHLDRDPRRVSPGGRRHGPWHDATSAFDGAAARAMGDLARARWKAATGETLAPCADCGECWPECLPGGRESGFARPRLAIARSAPAMKDNPPLHEVETAWLDLIAGARRMIYAESQYFASRRVARAIAQRLTEEDPPEIVLVTPEAADGWLEQLAMDTARARLVSALRRHDRQGRLRIYHPRTEGGAPIYVHAKVMVVDDHVLRVGSSNLNNRSMRLDTECDVILSVGEPGNEGLGPRIAALRDDLLAEHLGVEPAEVTRRLAETGSLIATVEALRGPGRSLEPYRIPALSDLESWLAENEILDPDGPEEIFEPTTRRGLFRGWDRLRARLRRGPGAGR
ncbi:phospholipase D-like domain-containing protein [Pseudogemmobacter sonorensis]|uniref:phospholipase D-like domain-containing protein n=1 Tax=Pseudogemmobacter sonorensis TaxID=2989681 RepID=UPI0036C0924A